MRRKMGGELFREMKRYIEFDDADAEALAALLNPLAPMLPGVVDEFYAAIERHPEARRFLTGGQTQVKQLRHTMAVWLRELFSGSYDTYYYRQRCEIGRTHVRINLPQHLMFTAMNVVRLSLTQRIGELKGSGPNREIRALHKILDLELAIMNETYRDAFVKRVQQNEHAEYEQRISEAQHLAAIGQLAASLAHEIKNPLAGISSAIQVLGSGLDARHPHKEIISEALRQIDRLDAAVKDLLVYARPKPPVTKRQSVDAIVQRVLILLREEPDFQGITIHCEGLDGDHQAFIDERQMQQVLTNLLLNAAQACDGVGSITCRIKSLQSKVRVLVEDRGCGMSPDVIERAFEPFYTTKARGTGLGLPICKRIIEAHGGTIEIQSFSGKGTRVTVELPS